MASQVAAESIRFSCPLKSESKLFLSAQKVLKTTFSSLNLRFQLIPMQELRAIRELKMGNIDGICAITRKTKENIFDNMLLMDHPIAQSHFVMWSRNNRHKLSKKNGPQNLPFKLGFYRSGTSEQVIRTYQIKNATVLTNSEQGIKMLAAGRLDAILGFNLMLTEQHHRLFKSDIPYSQQKFGILKMYPLLHSKHREIIDQVNSHFRREMENIGGSIGLGQNHQAGSLLAPP